MTNYEIAVKIEKSTSRLLSDMVRRAAAQNRTQDLQDLAKMEALMSMLRASVACNCPGGNKPADLHAPNCPVRQTQAKLLDPYDGGTWLASAPEDARVWGASTLADLCDAMDLAHELGGPPHERIKKLIKQRDEARAALRRAPVAEERAAYRQAVTLLLQVHSLLGPCDHELRDRIGSFLGKGDAA